MKTTGTMYQFRNGKVKSVRRKKTSTKVVENQFRNGKVKSE